MKGYSFVSVLSAAAIVQAYPLERRQIPGLGSGGSTSNELEDGNCRDVIFIFARGSTEPGNMGISVGPPTCSALKQDLGEDAVACQGVGGAYTADIASNALPAGTSPQAIQAATELFDTAHSKCPQSKIVAGGYSQGAALIANAVSQLPDDVKSHVKGVILYGYTKNAQTDGSIPGYPKEETKVFCNASDGVCDGSLAVTPGHVTYTTDVQDAAQFLAAQCGGGSGESGRSDSSGSSLPGLGGGSSGGGLGSLPGLGGDGSSNSSGSGGLGSLPGLGSGGGDSTGGLGGLSPSGSSDGSSGLGSLPGLGSGSGGSSSDNSSPLSGPGGGGSSSPLSSLGGGGLSGGLPGLGGG